MLRVIFILNLNTRFYVDGKNLLSLFYWEIYIGAPMKHWN